MIGNISMSFVMADDGSVEGVLVFVSAINRVMIIMLMAHGRNSGFTTGGYLKVVLLVTQILLWKVPIGYVWW